MTKEDVTKVAKAMIDVADGMEVLEKNIRNCGKTLLEITETISEFIDLPKKAPKENSAQYDFWRTKMMIRSKFMATKVKSSEIGFKVYFMKVLIFMFIVIFKILDVQVIENGSMLRKALIFFYLFNKGIILFENAKNIGLPFLVKLKSRLEQLHDKSGGEDKDA